MKHQKKGRKFGREKNQRRAFLKSLAVNLIMHGKIKTTLARAKELRPFAERLVTHVKTHNTPSAEYREISTFLPKEAVKVMMTKIGPAYKDRKGGYTRIIRIGQRVSDNSRMVFLEFVK